VVSDVEKAPFTVSGGDQEGERKRIAEDVSKCNQMTSKLGRHLGSGMSLAGIRLLAKRCPAWRRREPGLRLSHGTWEGTSRHSGSPAKAGPRREGVSQAAEPQGIEYRREACWRTDP